MHVQIHAIQEDPGWLPATTREVRRRGGSVDVSDSSPDGVPTNAGARPDEFVAVARAAGQRLHDISVEQAECSAKRQTAVRALRDRFGWSHQQVADALGISRSQAQSIYEGRSASGSARGQESGD